MSSNLKGSHVRLLSRIAALRERLKSQEEILAKDRQSTVAPAADFLSRVAGELATLEDDVRELTPALNQGRLAELSTRISVHFFVEKSMLRFCEQVLDELIKESGAGSGAVILFSPDTSQAKVVAARDGKKQSLPAEAIRVSRTILSEILEGKPYVLVEDALADPKLSGVKSIQDLRIRSVLAIPLQVQDYLAGAIHLESEASAGAFKEEERELLIGIGGIIAIYLKAAFRLEEEIAVRQRLYDEVKGKTHLAGMVGSSPRFLQVLETVNQVGPSGATVVIEGESGTGKELIARAIHLSSERAKRPMVVVNCAAIPETLLESELFGHEKGAFTGAHERRLGRFEQADGGTLFLDEIGELSRPVQAKLLRFLQSRELERLGGTQTIRVNVRLVAATCRDIPALVKTGDFREDLFYRLYGVPLKVPPLRERLEDIPLLVDHFSRVFALQAGRKPPAIDSEVYEIFQDYPWPGNVRELENLVQRLLVLSKGGRIQADDLPEDILRGSKATLDIEKNPFRKFLVNVPANYKELKRRQEQMQRIASEYAKNLQDKFVDTILERVGGNISRAAQESGMHRTLIHRNLSSRSLERDS